MAELPQKIGKYPVLGVAGQGAMGVVYTAYDPFTDRNVAIKLCSLGKDGPRARSRIAHKLFFNEAHTAASLDHPGLVKVLDAGEHEGEPYIVMEYIEGAVTLQSYCDPTTLLTIPRIAEIIFNAANVLDYAHRRGVVHRDIKPKNILLTPEGQVKICDFGIAHRSLDDTTQIMGVIGSPRYMSPEQIEEREVNNQSDLYSLGVVMYELLTGRPPHVASGLSPLLHSIVHEDPPDVRVLRPAVPEGLARIVRRALAKDPSRRYRKGREMAADLAAMYTDFAQPESDIDQDEEFERLRELRFFLDFSDAELWEVVRSSSTQKCAPGECIVTEGTLGLAFFVIVAGEVIVSREGRQLSTLSRGDCFGEMGFGGRMRRTASIIARDGVTLLRMEARAMEHLSTECQLRFNREFVQRLVQRLARADAVMAYLEPVPARSDRPSTPPATASR